MTTANYILRICLFCIPLMLAACNDVQHQVSKIFSDAQEPHQAQELFLRLQQGDLSGAHELIERAKLGDSAAAFYCGLAFDPGASTRTAEVGATDARAALNYYSQAAKFHVAAKHNLALLILRMANSEEGISLLAPGMNVHQALELLTAAAGQGKIESMLMLGSLLENGWASPATSDRLDKSPAQSVFWYEKAVTQFDDPYAQSKLGIAYLEGIGRSKNLQLAQTYLLAAAKSGIADAQFKMANLVTDPAAAIQWLLVAAHNSPIYQGAAEQAFSALPAGLKDLVSKNAEMWLHAHARPQRLLDFSKTLDQL